MHACVYAHAQDASTKPGHGVYGLNLMLPIPLPHYIIHGLTFCAPPPSMAEQLTQIMSLDGFFFSDPIHIKQKEKRARWVARDTRNRP